MLVARRDETINRERSLSIDSGHRRVARPLNAAHLLWGSAARHGDRPAVVERNSTVSYAPCGSAQRRSAPASCGGTDTNDRVAILLERGRDAARRSSARWPRARLP